MSPRSIFLTYVNPFIPWLIFAGLMVAADSQGEALIFDEGDSVEDYDEVDWDLLDESSSFCASPDAVAVLDEMLAMLDPDLASYATFDLFQSEAIVVVMTSPSSLSVSTAAMTELTPAQLAALLAHEVGHFRNGDVARLERNETMFDLMVTSDLSGYTGEQEELADQDAMDMMIVAGIPTDDVATLFADDGAGPATNLEFQAFAHPGLPARAQSWSRVDAVQSPRWEALEAVGLETDCTPLEG